MARPASEKYLLHREHVDYQTRKHVAVLIRPGLLALGSLLVVSIFFGITGSNLVTGVGGLAVMFLLLRLAWKIMEWRVDAVCITDWRIFEISGLVTRRVAALPLRKITDLTYETTPLGRTLGFGRFVLETAGQDQALTSLDYVPKPHDVYEILSHLTLHGPSGAHATQVGPRPSTSARDDDDD